MKRLLAMLMSLFLSIFSPVQVSIVRRSAFVYRVVALADKLHITLSLIVNVTATVENMPDTFEYSEAYKTSLDSLASSLLEYTVYGDLEQIQ